MNKKKSIILTSVILILLIILSTFGIVTNLNVTKANKQKLSDEHIENAQAEQIKVTYGKNEVADINNAFKNYVSDRHILSGNGLFNSLSCFKDVLCCQHNYRLSNYGNYSLNATWIDKGSPAQSYILAHLVDTSNPYYSNVQYAWWGMIDALGIRDSFTSKVSNGVFTAELPFETYEFNCQVDDTISFSAGAETKNNNKIYDETLKNILETEKFNVNNQNIDNYVKYVSDVIRTFSTAWQSDSDIYSDAGVKISIAKEAIENYVKFYNELKNFSYNGDTPEGYYNKNKNYGSSDRDVDRTGWNDDAYLYANYFLGNDSYYLDWNPNTNNYSPCKNTERTKKVFGDFQFSGSFVVRPKLYQEMQEIVRTSGLAGKEVELLELIAEAIDDSTNVEWNVGGNYNVKSTKDMLDAAAKYEAFVKKLEDTENAVSVKADRLEVNVDQDKNLYVVGPISVKYITETIHDNDWNTDVDFARLGNFYVKTERDGNEFVLRQSEQNEGQISGLTNDMFAIVKSYKDAYKYKTSYEVTKKPESEEEFFIVFLAGQDNKLVEIGFDYEYLCNESDYAYFEIGNSGIQDLADVGDARLWYERKKITQELPQTVSFPIKKEVVNDEDCNQSFYFWIYATNAPALNAMDPIEYNDKTYYIQDSIELKAGETAWVESIPFYKNEEVPSFIVVETDQYGVPYNEYKKPENRKENSVWETYQPIEDDGSRWVASDRMGWYFVGNEEIDLAEGLKVKNEEKEKYTYLYLDKKITENKNNDTFNVKLTLNKNSEETNYIIPLQPTSVEDEVKVYTGNFDEERNAYICETDLESNHHGEELGTILRGKWDEMEHAKFFYITELKVSDEFSYTVEEVDIPEGYDVPRYEYLYGNKIVPGGTSNVVITNTLSKPDFPVELTLHKELVDSDGNKIELPEGYEYPTYNFKITLEKVCENNDIFSEYKHLSVKADGKDSLNYSENIVGYNENDEFKLIVKEEGNNFWKDVTNFTQSSDTKWVKVDEDKDGSIDYIYTILPKDESGYTAEFTVENVVNYGQLNIRKQVTAGEKDVTARFFEENPDAYFLFRIAGNINNNISISDFEENNHVFEKDGCIYVKIDASNYETGVTSKVITWINGKIAPSYEIYEVDTDYNTYLQWIEYGQNKNPDSIFAKYQPENGGHETITLENMSIAISTFNNKANGLKDRFKITKVSDVWEDDEVFYFKVVSLDGTYTNLVDKYFDEENIVTLENGIKAVKVTKENSTVESKEISWTPYDDNPQFYISEVDKYGNTYTENPSKEDSIWNYYIPRGYGTLTCQLLGNNSLEYDTYVFENYSKQITLFKNIEINGIDDTEAYFDKNPKQKFKFKFYDEEGNDVTVRYFGTNTIIIDKDNYSTGVTSKPIKGIDKKYTFKEIFDDDEANKWDNNKQQTINLADYEESKIDFEFVNEINKANISIRKDFVDVEGLKEADKEQKFTAIVNVVPDKYTKTMYIDGKPQWGYQEEIKVSYNEHYMLPEIIWTGSAPTVLVSEVNIPEGWALKENQVNGDIISGNAIDLNYVDVTNPIIYSIVNTRITNLPIIKNTVDQEGKLTKVLKDTDFYFDVYTQNGNGEYEFLEKVTITVKEGTSQGRAEINGLPDGTKYKVVEVDDQGRSYANRGDSEYWKTTKPTTFNKWGSGNGEWEGILNINNPTPECSIEAYNQINKAIINLSKVVLESDGRLSKIEEGEEFNFKVLVVKDSVKEITNEIKQQVLTQGEDVKITDKDQTWSKEFTYNIDETVTVIVIETCPDGKMYGSCDCDFWKEFTPIDGEGIITKEINSTSKVDVSLLGQNIRNGHIRVTKKFENSSWEIGKYFYFIVEDKDGNDVTEELFPNDIKDGKVQLAYTDNQKISVAIPSNGINKEFPKYKVVEVDSEGHRYNDKCDCELWKEYTPANKTGEYTAIVSSRADAFTKIINNKNYQDQFEIKKKVIQGQIETSKYDDLFYVIVKDKDGNNVVEKLFSPENGGDARIEYITSEEIPAVVIGKANNTQELKATTKVITWRTDEFVPEYEIIEVDYNGNKFGDQDIADEKSVWNKGYAPAENNGVYNVKLNPQLEKTQEINSADDTEFVIAKSVINVKNNKDNNGPINYQIIKKVKDADGNYIDGGIKEGEAFYFKVTDKNGKDVATNLFKDESFIEVDENKLLVIDIDNQELTSIETYNKGPYTVTETDQFGKKYGEQDSEESIWNKYQPENGTGIWKLDENQPANIVVNVEKYKEANIYLRKDYADWQPDTEFKFNVYIKYDGKSEETLNSEPIVLTQNNNIWKYDGTIKWLATEKNPIVYIEELDVTKETVVTLNVAGKDIDVVKTQNENGLYTAKSNGFELQNKADMMFVCTNKVVENKSANVEIIKTTNIPTNEVFTFKYQYSLDDGKTWMTEEEPIVINGTTANATSGIGKTRLIDWNSLTDPTPKFRIWEDLENSSTEVKWTVDNTDSTIVDGKLEGYVNSEKQVRVKAENKNTSVGGIKVVKQFNAPNKQTLAAVCDLLDKYRPDWKMEFTLTVTAAENSNFKYGGKFYTSEKFTVELTTEDIRNALNTGNESIAQIELFNFDEKSIEWFGNSAPSYKVTENNGQTFYTGIFSENSSASLIKNDVVKVICSNTCLTDWDVTLNAKLYTSLGGMVWIENQYAQKEGKEANDDNRYNSGYDTLASDVKVVPVRLIINSNNEVIAQYLNDDPEHGKFLYTNFETNRVSASSEYLITEADKGNWNFSDVAAPVFDLKNPEEAKWFTEGCKVKYDIRFYYDGAKYKAVNALESYNNVDEYINSDKTAGYNDSHATETANIRKDLNEKYATVEGKTPMTADGKSTGVIKDKNGNIVQEVKYTAESVQEVGNSKVTRISTTSDLAFEKFEMEATTANTGLKYFLSDEISTSEVPESTLTEVNAEDITLEDVRIENKDGVDTIVYYYGTGKAASYEYEPIEYAQHINLGLKAKDATDLSIEKKAVSATILVNDKSFTYDLNPDAKDAEALNEVPRKFTSAVSNELLKLATKDTLDESKLNVYTSDYCYRIDQYNGTKVGDALDTFYKAIYGVDYDNVIKSKELQVFITYKISIGNHSGYNVRVNALDDYFDSRLEYVDVGTGFYAVQSDDSFGKVDSSKGPGLWAYVENEGHEETSLTNLFADKEAYCNNTIEENNIEYSQPKNTDYKKMHINYGEKINSSSYKEFYLTYKAHLEDIFNTPVNNIVEISSFTAFDNDGNYVGVIDSNSAPGNYNIDDATAMNIMEDDTDFSNVEFVKAGDGIKRTISGTAWLDDETINGTNKDGQLLGDSKMSNGEKLLSGITTKLVEVIDVPVVDESGNITKDYKEYEFYWPGTELTTGEDGIYTLDSYNITGEITDGLVPGNYIVRFFYGDREVKTGNGIIINGEDYKATAYEINNPSANNYIDNEWYSVNDIDDNEARDNEARRLSIIEKTQELKNSNTAIFEVANYETAEDYAKAKTINYLKTIGEIVDESNITSRPEYSKYIEQYEDYKKQLLVSDVNIENGNVAYNGIIDGNGYYMFADTAKMNMKVEVRTDESDETKTGKALGITFEGMNLGLEERSKTNIVIDKQIEEITLTTSSGKIFANVKYDISYALKDGLIKDLRNIKNSDSSVKYDVDNMTETEINNAIFEEFKYKPVDKNNGLYVKIEPQEFSTGLDNIQALSGDEDNQGFRYINVDTAFLQGLTEEVKYKITTFNFSETDRYGEGLERIKNNEESFETAIETLTSPDYIINGSEDGLLRPDGNAKTYGEYLGHTYYQGFNGDYDADKYVTTTVRQIVDYVDNDINIDLVNSNNEEGSTWNQINSQYLLDNELLDKEIVRAADGAILDDTERPYSTIVINKDSKGEGIVKELLPIGNELNENNVAATTISESKVLASTDDGHTGVDNLIEIILLENTVGRRDDKVVHGNYNPMGGSKMTTERDESSSDLITLSPPTGYDKERAKTMEIVIASLTGTSVLAVGIILIKKKILM